MNEIQGESPRWLTRFQPERPPRTQPPRGIPLQVAGLVGAILDREGQGQLAVQTKLLDIDKTLRVPWGRKLGTKAPISQPL